MQIIIDEMFITYISVRYQTGWQLFQELGIPYDMMKYITLDSKYKQGAKRIF